MAYSIPRRVLYPRRWGLALLPAIILLSFILFLPHYPPPPEHGFPWHKEWWRPSPFEGYDRWRAAPHAWTEKTWRMSPPELRSMISGTNGYYVRDWSVGLGWNNLRYIIEASLLHAKLLNRVLVLPSFVYARSCEFPQEVCTQYGLFVDRAEVVGWDTWSGAPLNTLAWQIPMQVMIDLPHLRESHPVILASEFFELHGLNSNFESLAGDWNRGDYEENVTFPSIHVIPNGDYDPSSVVRVDTLDGLPTVDTKDSYADEMLQAALGDNLVLQWDDAKDALQSGHWPMETDEDIEKIIVSAGWVVTHTFLGAGGMDYTKTVVDPIKQVTPRSSVRGLVQDYSPIKAEVLLLEGELHLGRKPGGLRFTTESASQDFARLVLHGFRPVAPVRELARSLAERMTKRCNGRLWMAAHMRRGDFVAVGWAMEKTLEAHFSRIQTRLEIGRERLSQVAIPEAHTAGLESDDEALQSSLLPLEGDPFLLATDERDPQNLAYLRNNSAVLIEDLLTIEDRRTFGWPMMFTDVLALIEQSLAAESSYFYGHALSSFAGGVLNMRTARGADLQTTFID